MTTPQEGPTHIVFLKGKKTVLRPFRESDIPLITKWMNDPEVTQFIRSYLPITEPEERTWFADLSKRKPYDIVLGIEVEGKLIGTMGIHGIKWADRTATTGALIGEKEYWGKGYGTDAKMVLLNYAFNTLNLRKLCSSVIAFNTRSLRYSLHCGYTIEGRKKKQIFRHGRYYDEIMLGLFKNDWLPYWKKYKES